MDLKDVVLVGRKASTRTQKGATQATDLARKPAGRNNTARTGGGGATKAEDLKIISWGIGLP